MEKEEGIVYEYDNTAIGCISRTIVSVTDEYKVLHPEEFNTIQQLSTDEKLETMLDEVHEMSIIIMELSIE